MTTPAVPPNAPSNPRIGVARGAVSMVAAGAGTDETVAVEGPHATPTAIAMITIQLMRRGCSTTRRTYPYPRTMPERGATVEFRAVTKRYADQTAVDALSLQVPAGKICILVGPSGSGKTTSLKMVNRLIEPTSRAILIDGVDVLQEDPVQLRRRIGYVIQQVGLFPHQTIVENVGTVPRLLGWPETRIASRATELLALVGLDPGRYGKRYPAQLSGGERQRARVARPLAAEPPVMLMDEPVGAVDPIVPARLQGHLLRIHPQLGTTILFV